MPQASLIALLDCFKSQADWLNRQAVEFETGQRKLTGKFDGKEVDISANIAAEYRHKAINMEAILVAYERLHAKGQ